MTEHAGARLLIVDDEAAQLKALCDTLGEQGYRVTGFASATQALEHLREHSFEALLTDLMMPEMDGITLLNTARGIVPELSCIVMTGHATVDNVVQALKGGAVDYVLKPFKLSTILPVIERALAMYRLRQLVKLRTAELEQSNRDLEAFSYSVSHDLRAPLRAISGFYGMYMEDFGAGVPENGRHLLEKISENAQRMSQLIEDLLTFARYGNQKVERRRLSMRDLVHGVLARAEGNPAAAVTIGELPECVGDPALLEQVLINLISNAFKFTREREAPRIEIGSRAGAPDGSETVYFVRDNGAGFNMKYANKLFGVFQRLHSQSEFEGTGVGLSIVQRIIVRHGGRVWADAAPGAGATFFFSLPTAAPDEEP